MICGVCLVAFQSHVRGMCMWIDMRVGTVIVSESGWRTAERCSEAKVPNVSHGSKFPGVLVFILGVSVVQGEQCAFGASQTGFKLWLYHLPA